MVDVPAVLVHHPPEEVDLRLGELPAEEGLADDGQRLGSIPPAEEVDPVEQLCDLIGGSGDLVQGRGSPGPRPGGPRGGPEVASVSSFSISSSSSSTGPVGGLEVGGPLGGPLEGPGAMTIDTRMR